jgi:hypothetical protein
MRQLKIGDVTITSIIDQSPSTSSGARGPSSANLKIGKITPDQSCCLMRRLATAGALYSLCALSLLSVVPAHAQQHPPNCSDQDSVKGVRAQYNGLEAIRQATTRIKEIKDVAETYFGAAPGSFNQYANSNDHVLTVRWCQATLVLNDGQDDTVYWFLADEQKGDRHSTVQDHCSTRHNLLDETCAKWREHR